MSEPEGTLRSVALKHGDMYLVSDQGGDLVGPSDGLYHNDTRILSHMALSLAGRPLSLLGSGVERDNVLFTAHLTNRSLPPIGGSSAPEGIVHIKRSRLIWQDRLFEHIRLTNFGACTVSVPLTIALHADFADMFEVRGMTRAGRGSLLDPVTSDDRLGLAYHGLDNVARKVWVQFSVPPCSLNPDRAVFDVTLQREQAKDLYLEIGPDGEDMPPSQRRHRRAVVQARWEIRQRRQQAATLRSSSGTFNEWLDQSRADLALLTTELPTGPYPYAGIPWFSTAFGRDAIITALQVLWIDPNLARGVLRFLAAHQATETDPFRDAQPGKIMHETRKGEMTSLGEVPFARYYGGVDTTPLFVMLAGAYAKRTGDASLVNEIWPNLCAAMDWVAGLADSNEDGFVDYQSARPTGLANQGWKDSNDSVFHQDGSFPRGPIALIEVQGLAYAASLAMADMSEMHGDLEGSTIWRRRAAVRAKSVEDRFWNDEIRCYGLAIDGAGDLCAVRSSNAGQLLFTGLAKPQRAAEVIRTLLAREFSSGWGLRTLATSEVRYNPMSYHNGSVWPHDTALCAAGMAQYGERAGVVRLTDELFAASRHFGMRLPELYCGFDRQRGQPVIAYPVACQPQAWASGSVFMMLQSCLGLQISGGTGEVVVERPHLPSALDRLEVRNLAMPGGMVDLCFERTNGQIAVRSSGATDIRVTVRR